MAADVRRTIVPFMARWINSLCIWPVLEPEQLLENLRTGVLLCKLVQFFSPQTRFLHLHHKPRTRKLCVSNLEQALSIIWRENVAANRMCTADDIFEGNLQMVGVFLKSLLDVLIVRDIRQQHKNVQAFQRERSAKIKSKI